MLTKASGTMEAENKKLKAELEAAKERYRKMWHLTCEQSCEQEELLVAQQEEIDRLSEAQGCPLLPPGR